MVARSQKSSSSSVGVAVVVAVAVADVFWGEDVREAEAVSARRPVRLLWRPDDRVRDGEIGLENMIHMPCRVLRIQQSRSIDLQNTACAPCTRAA